MCIYHTCNTLAQFACFHLDHFQLECKPFKGRNDDFISNWHLINCHCLDVEWKEVTRSNNGPVVIQTSKGTGPRVNRLCSEEVNLRMLISFATKGMFLMDPSSIPLGVFPISNKIVLWTTLYNNPSLSLSTFLKARKINFWFKDDPGTAEQSPQALEIHSPRTSLGKAAPFLPQEFPLSPLTGRNKGEEYKNL